MRPKFTIEALFFWLGLFTISFFVMAQNVHASGTVAVVYQWSYDGVTWQGSAAASCDAYKAAYNAPTYTVAGVPPAQICNFEYPAGIVPLYLIWRSGCPSNSTGAATCTCTDPYIPNADATACVMPASCPANSHLLPSGNCGCDTGFANNPYAGNVCSPECPTTGTVASSGFYDGGDDLAASFPAFVCAGSCRVTFYGNYPAASTILNGTKHYLAEGSYKYSGYASVDSQAGAFCNVGSTPNLSPTFAYSKPASGCPQGQNLIVFQGKELCFNAGGYAPDSCGPGQSKISMNGITKCLNSDGSAANPNSASAVASAASLAAANQAAAVAAAANAAAAAGLSASGVESAKASAIGSTAGVMNGATNTGFAPTDPMNAYCISNPQAPLCKSQLNSVAAKTGAALPDTSSDWYTKKYPQGITGVFTANFNAAKSTPLAGLITQMVPTISGSAHNGCFILPIWKVGNQQICIPPLVLQALGVFMILTALFSARAIIFGG